MKSSFLSLSLTLTLICLFTLSANAQWLSSGTNIKNTNAGNVGIGTGTAVPGAKLQVIGTESNGSTIGVLKLTSGTQNMLLDGNEIDVVGAGLYLQSNSPGVLGIAKGGGKVGIGTHEPEYKMHVVGNRIRLANNETATAKTIDLRTDGTQVDITANNGHLFLNSLTGNTIIQPSGNRVGIGTASPDSKLHVDGAESDGSTAGAFKITSGDQNMLLDGNEIDVIGKGLYLQGNSPGVLGMAKGGGKVGIGTHEPEYKMHVVGNRIRLANNETANAKTIDLRTDGNQVELIAENANLHISAGNGNTILQAASHRVGIGTASPDTKLHVEGLESNGDTEATLKLTSGDQNMLLDGNEIDVIGKGLYLQGNSPGVLGMVKGGGKVGIGTHEPAHKLHVVGDRIRLSNIDNDSATTLDLRTDGNQPGLVARNNNLFLASASGNTIIQASGRNVGIGTNSPDAKLHIEGADNDGTTGSLKITSGTQNMVLDGNEIDAIGDALYLNHNSNSNVILATGGGNVRIGTDGAPAAAKLDVSGDVRCFNLFTNSDRRYKTGIRTVESALDKVLAMRGASYDFAAEQLPAGYTAGKQVGFIAQEMKDVMPELVKADGEGMMSVNYIGVIPVLVEALKEQHEVIAEKENRIAALETQNTELKDRLARIEAALGLAAERQQAPAAVNATVSPNPTSGLVTISLSNTTSARSVTVKIMDSTGREVANRNATSDSSIQFDLSQFPSGVYVAQVVADGNLVSTNKVQLVK